MAAGDAIIEPALDGTASENTTELQAALDDGRQVMLRPGNIDFVPPLVVPRRGLVLWGAGAADGSGTPVRGSVLIPTSGAATDTCFVNENAGRLCTTQLFGGFTIKGPPGEYHGMRFDGIGNNTTLLNIRVDGCRSGILLNNGYDADNSAAWHAQIIGLTVTQHTEDALALVRSDTNPGTAAMGIQLGVYGFRTTNPAGNGGRSLRVHNAATLQVIFLISSFSFEDVNGITAAEAVSITNTTQADIMFQSGRAELTSSQNFINIDTTSHYISVVGVDTGSGDPAVYPDLLVRTPQASADIPPLDTSVTPSIPTVVHNSRLPAWQ